MIKALIISNLTIDHNRIAFHKTITPGGPAYFCAKVFENLKVHPYIASPFGQDFPKFLLPNSIIYHLPDTKHPTIIFENIYLKGKRKQKIRNYQAENLSLGNLSSEIIKDKQIVIVAPILPNIREEDLLKIRKIFPQSLLVLSPQGFFRLINQDRTISYHEWGMAKKIIPLFDLVILSEKDLPDSGKKALEWSMDDLLVIVTKAEKGCTVFQKGKIQDFPAHKVIQVEDATGAGDIFTAAFSYSYLQNRNFQEAAVFANAVAAHCLTLPKKALDFKIREIIINSIKKYVCCVTSQQ